MSLATMCLPFASGFALTVMVMAFFIHYFQMRKYGQEIREEGPKWHNIKAGTPTMGGFVFLLSAFVSSVWVGLWQGQLTPALLILLFILLLYGLLGFLDDFIKIFKKRNMGLTSLQKLFGQIVGAIAFYLVFLYEGNPNVINLFGFDLPLSYLYGVFVIFWLVGFSNAVNLADGIDGLVAGLATISFATYAIIAWHQARYDILIIC